jgi:prepilin-type N-terminal cleavage/methylation domain-containing protein
MLSKRVKSGPSSLPARVKGMTLIEMMVAMIISLVVSSGMVIVMSNTLGSGTGIIQQTHLLQEMRTGMQIMSRELRRANYQSGWLTCYGNPNCLVDLGIDGQIRQIQIENDTGDDDTDADCFWFWYDRDSLNSIDEDVTAFRRWNDVNSRGQTAGRIQMATADTNDADSCPGAEANWADITDPELINVTDLTLTDAQSYTETISVAGATLDVEKIGISMTAEMLDGGTVSGFLKPDAGVDRTSRRVQSFIRVRNDTSNAAP